ncbi:MAG: hydroxymethylglutaryl-CoA reductase, degradative [Candidatus Competibacteraceae bacterium]|nr:hydroxymethylglutaryl-CoA reductase, degradative [Candidatus Competibacteraceae bacterium]MCB1811151.1 hydroxymethylglutaryl-CoA reductase, degradative [Candidatus Competibacteraceae bacterium]
MSQPTSRLSGFYKLDQQQRLKVLQTFANLEESTLNHLANTGNTHFELVDRLVENAVGVMNVPLGIATNLRVDGRDVLVPMATEESSVIAAVGNAARQCRDSGGIFTSFSGSLMIAQVQLVNVSDPWAARARLLEQREQIAAICNATDPLLVKLGGGFRELEIRLLDSRSGPLLIVHLIIDTRDAMGANAVNSMAEKAAPALARIAGGQHHLRILSNLADRRLARARAVWHKDAIGGADVAAGILLAAHFAEADPYRAATHNKGIMNGISAVTLATGNDTRAIEAGAHAYAARNGQYQPLSRFELTADGDISGSLEVPLALGLVGGATKAHPTAQACLAILGVSSAEELARIVAAVGLAQNFSALKALATTGIQQGHMALHAQNIALAAGAVGDEIEQLARAMVEQKTIRQDFAEQLLAELRNSTS